MWKKSVLLFGAAFIGIVACLSWAAPYSFQAKTAGSWESIFLRIRQILSLEPVAQDLRENEHDGDVNADNRGKIIRVLRNYDERAVETGTGNYGLAWEQAAASAGYAEFKGNTYFYFRGEKGDAQAAESGDSFTSLPYAHKYDGTKESVFKWDADGEAIPLFEPHISDSINNEIVMSLGEEYQILYNGAHYLSPVVFRDKVYMFYMHYIKAADREYDREKIFKYASYATSEDGISFTDCGRLPNDDFRTEEIEYFTYAAGLSAFVKDDKLYIAYRGDNIDDSEWYGDIVLSGSTDGISWTEPKRILDDSAKYALWDDEFALDTMNFFSDEQYLYMLYGSTLKGTDYPEGFGIARARLDSDISSENNWEPYPYNPVMLRGPAGAADSGAVWAPTVYKYEGSYYVFYEGCGFGDLSMQDNRYKEALVKRRPYAYYRKESFSNIMVAEFNTDDLASDWSVEPITGKVRIKNAATGRYLSIANDERAEVASIKTDNAGTVFDLSYKDNFFQIKYGDKAAHPAFYDEDKPEDAEVLDKILFGSDGISGGINAYFSATESKREMLAQMLEALNFKSAGEIAASKLIPPDNPESIKGAQWQIIPDNNGYYAIQNRATGCLLKEEPDGKTGQTQINNADVRSDLTEKWLIEEM